MDTIKDKLFSQKGMTIVNGLFLLSVIFRGSVFSLMASGVWLAYLLHGIKTAESKTVRIILSAFAVFAAALTIVSILILLKII